MYCSTARVASKPFTAKRAANFDRRMSSSRVQAQPQKATLEQKRALIESVDCFIFDCDGVIWKGDKLIEGVPETLDFLREQGKKLFFVTNNSTKSRAGYLKKFLGLGLDISAEEIYSSSYAAAAYLEATKFPSDKKVYVVGDVGIEEELDLLNINHIGGPSDADKKVELTPGTFMEHDKDVAAVIVGFDRNINYHKIQYATLCIRENPGCEFIATNLDAVTHLTDAQEWAGNGAMVGAIKGSTKREPTVVGKPADFMLRNIAEKGNLEMLAQSREQADEKENRRKDDLRSNYIEKIKGLIKLTEREEG